MKASRNSQGRFIKGHKGFKPKGARSVKRKRSYEPIDILTEFLTDEIIKTIPSLKPAEAVRFYVRLLNFIVPKCKRISYEDFLRLYEEPDDEEPDKIVFQVIDSSQHS